MTRPLGDWRSREGLVKGEYASDVILLGWLPGRTRHAVAIDLGEGLGIQNDRGQQTLTNCKVVRRVKYLHAFKRTKLQNIVTIFRDKNRQKNVLINASFWCDVSWWTSPTRRRVGRPTRN